MLGWGRQRNDAMRILLASSHPHIFQILPETLAKHITYNSFALLCRVGKPVMSPDGRSVALQDPDMLERATIRVAQFLLTFFVDSDRRVVRPYTNSNFILDFYRYRHSPYYVAFVKYLQHKRIKVPSYDKQYEGITMFYSFVKNLHGYDKFVLEGATSSTPNSKSLQHVQSTEGASRKLGRGDYYKYRAVNLMFGCNAGAMQGIGSFSEFNAWRKNQLLSFYDVIRGRIAGLAEEICGAKLSKYRDYCEFLRFSGFVRGAGEGACYFCRYFYEGSDFVIFVPPFYPESNMNEWPVRFHAAVRGRTAGAH